MEKIIYFDVCALPIFTLILIATRLRRTTKGNVNRLFICVTVLSLLSTIMDIACEVMNGIVPLRASHPGVTAFLYYCYFIPRNATIFAYVFFLYAYMRRDYLLRRFPVRLLIWLPATVMLAVLLTNPAHHGVFTVTAEHGYERGPLLLVLYAGSLLYAFWGIALLARCRTFISFREWLVLMSIYFLTFAAIFFQFTFPAYLVEPFSTAVSFLILILMVLRPEEITDVSVGLPSFTAYQHELRKILLVRQPVQVLALRFLNAWRTRDYLGDGPYNNYIRLAAAQIESYAREQGMKIELYYEGPDGMYIIFSDIPKRCSLAAELPGMYRAVATRTNDFLQTGARLDVKMCLMDLPQDAATAEAAVSLGHCFPSLLPYEQQFVRAADIVDTLRYKIENNMDVILRRAIQDRRFEMYYQPIYALQKKRFASAEALIRLRDEEFGFVSPGLFIPAAERKGLMLAIGDFVLESVFRFASECDFAALGLEYVEINLSLAQCMDRSLPARVRALQEKYGVLPERINFEILETTYESITTIADKNIRELSEMGYSFSLDDYGTGYSNIQRVVSLPLKIIKLDKCFVDALHTENGLSILRDTVRTMQSISKELVVEGVETKEAVDQLDAMRCDFIQGFYYSKPLPESEFIAFLRRHNG